MHNKESTDLLPKLSTNVTESFGPIKACCLKPSISQHLCHLGILCNKQLQFALAQIHNFVFRMQDAAVDKHSQIWKLTVRK